MVSHEQAKPTIHVDPRLVDQPPWGPFESVTINGEAVASLMESWGVSAPNRSDTIIDASPETPQIEWDFPNIPARVPKLTYSECRAHRVMIYMGNVARTLRETPVEQEEGEWDLRKRFQEIRQAYARDASARLVEALSYRADDVILGDAVLREEVQRAEKLIKIRKAVPRAVGALATSAVTVGAAYANHRFDFAPEALVGLLGSPAIVVSGLVAWSRTSSAVLKQKYKNTRDQLWPADRRADARRDYYCNDRNSGKRPELVTYKLRAE